MHSVTGESIESSNTKYQPQSRCSQIAAKITSIVVILFSLPTNSPAQRWDKVTEFPVTPSFFTGSVNTITSGPDGALWYTDSSRQVVGRMTTAGVSTEYSICCNPQGITTGPDGALWFGFSSGVGRITTDGTLTPYSLPNCCPGVQGVTPGPDGALWFTEGGCCGGPTGSRIGRITTAGVITEFGQIAGASPLGIVAGRDGALWFTEQNGNRIGRITTAGAIVEFPVPSCCGLQAITAAQDGALWFTEPNANKIGRITTHGVITEYPLPTANSFPFGITGGPDGALWFTEQQGNRVGRINLPSGNVDAVIIEYPLTTLNSSPSGIASGPDGALWFNQATAIGRAAACGLGLNVTFTNGNLNMAFDLGTSRPGSFGTYLIEGATLQKLWSFAIPAIDPPVAFAKSITGFPASGSVAVFSLVSTTPSGLACYDLELVDTGAAIASPAMLENARRVIRDSGIVSTLPEP
jgi:virginiamycin B lyase